MQKKQFAVDVVPVDCSRPNLCICAMENNNDTQHVNTVRKFEVGVGDVAIKQ